jgi:hypothetical protein
LERPSVLRQSPLTPDFQAKFDGWKVQVEKEQGGSLEIVAQETLQDGSVLLIFWRIVPRKHAAGRR